MPLKLLIIPQVIKVIFVCFLFGVLSLANAGDVLTANTNNIEIFVDSDEEDDFAEFAEDDWTDIEISLDYRGGYWRNKQTYLTDRPLNEARVQFELDKATDYLSYSMAADFIYDDVTAAQGLDLEKGKGWLDLRGLNISFTPIAFMDVKVGRQIVTWGTGDLIFINDLFPKDWNSFFIGRKENYLKAPSDAIKIALFNDIMNLDLVYTPLFDADRYIDGQRTSFFNPQINQITGTNSGLVIDQPDQFFESQEFALRAYRNVANYELASYGYYGYWKSPTGINSQNAELIFPRLSVLGVSLRGPLLTGIANAEFGQYRSADDIGGTSPFIPNSEFRGLLGYEQEAMPDLTVAVQYYFRIKNQYDNYLNAIAANMFAENEIRHELSVRLTGMAFSQKIRWTVFSLYAPRDEDGFMRSSLNYQQNDHCSYSMGGMLLFGESINTDKGQFQNNDNIYIALRYAY